ncbi:MAG: Ig-like domain-containing protein [Deltaproteobacteria bacterium]|nr:Ig-like domain-containing protein [Deltaproteobacteria bacterium]
MRRSVSLDAFLISGGVITLGVVGASLAGCPAPSTPDDAGLDAYAEIDATNDARVEPDAPLPPDAFVDRDGGIPSNGCGMDAGTSAGGGAGDPPAPDSYPTPITHRAAQRTFLESELGLACAGGFLDGGETDRDHHNGVFVSHGLLFMSWAHQDGGGGVSAWDIADPCAPVLIGQTTDTTIRETHATGQARIDGRDYLVTASLEGVMFWDVTDPSAPERIVDMTLPGVSSEPDAYMHVVMSVFWQAPYVYVGAADNGVFVLDASDPHMPRLLTQWVPDPRFRVGGVHAIGNLLAVIATEGGRTTLYDVSDPIIPRAIPGGTWTLINHDVDRRGRPIPRLAYMGHMNGNRMGYARRDLGGGFISYDITDPSMPTLLQSWNAPDMGNGGYVFFRDESAFVGESAYASELDLSGEQPVEVRRYDIPGDVDFITPIGNIAYVSVDDDAIPGQATAAMPQATAPDAIPPSVNMVVPRDGETNVGLLSRVGITLTDFTDVASVHAGSFYVREVGTTAPLEGTYSAQEGVVNFAPAAPLDAGTTYEIVVPAGGLLDAGGTAIASAFRSTFTTVPCR